MQIIVEVGIDPGSYVNEEYQRRVRAPSVCPNCGTAQALEAHDYCRHLSNRCANTKKGHPADIRSRPR
ncbi:MAG TPA: hypothetical protein VIS99_07525 [Terrimicrobiaceae bacterium]